MATEVSLKSGSTGEFTLKIIITQLFQPLLLFSSMIAALMIQLLVISNCFSQQGWLQQNSGINSNLYSVQFIDSNTGWCAGANGIILKTSNGGANWLQQVSGTSQLLRSISFTSHATGYAAGDTGTFLKTTNGGESWFPLNLISNINYNSICFVNDTVGYAGGFHINQADPTSLFKTTDGGTTWDSTETGYIYQVHFLNQMTGWIIDGSLAIQWEGLSKTTNGGVNWIGQYAQSSWKELNVFFVDSLYGWMAGRRQMFSVIYRSTNGGNDWFEPGFPFTASATSMFFINRTHGWATGIYSGIGVTTNGGINWTYQYSPPANVQYNSIYFIDSLTGWCVGDSGRIVKTTTGGIIVSVDPVATSIPEEYRLFQNYPNPFNPETIIKFSIPSNVNSQMSDVRLIVYDALGREAAVLVNEKKVPGNYSVEFDAGDFSSGVYFYSLSANGNLIDAKRMILLK